ncbi:MAG: hypothetical protein QOD74_690 [Variibacter sp.]|jgi:SAM-dependent methyltransferase|nr:hypothetical protein [Variibacter sp.]
MRPTALAAWESAVTAAAHVFDRHLVRVRQRRASAIGPANFLLHRVADDLVDRLDAVIRRFDVAVDLGTPGAAVRDALAAHARVNTVIAVHPMCAHMPRSGPAVAAEEEALPFRNGSLDLVVSALALQLVNDLPGALIQIRRALKPNGLFLAALLGGDTLTELRQAFATAEEETTGGISPRVAPFVDVRALGSLLQRAGFALPVTDLDRVTVRYDSPFSLMRDLRRMGGTNPLRSRRRLPLRRATLMRAADSYARTFSDEDGRIRATFDIVWLSGWAPDESQQKPLKPGAAVTRLADALKTHEISAGEKTGR